MADYKENVYKLKKHTLQNKQPVEQTCGTAWNLQQLLQNIHIKVVKINDDNKQNLLDMEFDLVGVGPPIANAIRRILIAEVPTMAIDKIELYNNTTVIPDEVLTHRIGLIPIKADPRLFVSKPADDSESTEEDTIQFELKVKCTRRPNVLRDAPDEQAFNHSKVYSRDLKFIPIGNQENMYGEIEPVHGNILLCVMKPGHEIDLQAYCYKNKGREHAKFSPVVIASYRLLPQLRLLKEVKGEHAHYLSKCFPEGVVHVSKKNDVAKVVNPRLINCSRNVFLHEDLKDAVEVSKVKDHYIFTVESAGAIHPVQLVVDALDILKEKCRCFLNELKSLERLSN